MLGDRAAEVITALVISALVSFGLSLRETDTQRRLLEDNVKVTHNLAIAVTELRVQLAVFGEKYVTREELERRLAAHLKED